MLKNLKCIPFLISYKLYYKTNNNLKYHDNHILLQTLSLFVSLDTCILKEDLDFESDVTLYSVHTQWWYISFAIYWREIGKDASK